MKDTFILHGHTLTRDWALAFKRAYLAAVARPVDEYTFQGHAVLTSYAKHVIEYAESQLGPLDTTRSTPMTVRQLIDALRLVRNQDAGVAVCTQLETDMPDCIVHTVDASRSEFGDDMDGAVWLRWPGADWDRAK